MAELEPRRVEVRYLEQPCKTALNPVKGMGFNWSLNPYMGCEHRCTFCYVRAYEKRADRPSDDAYGRSIRVKTNVAEVLRRELSRPGWKRETVAIGAATDPYQPAEGRYRLTRACLQAFADLRSPVSLITRGPLIVRDVDLLAELDRRAQLTVTFSIPTLDDEVWRRTEPGTAHPRQRLRPSCPASATVLSSWRRWSVPPGRRGRATSGAACCICATAPVSTSWQRWRGTGRSCCRATWRIIGPVLTSSLRRRRRSREPSPRWRHGSG
jgi:hypothetical protein